MDILQHHIYEYKKGVRSLILYTFNKKFRDSVIKTVEKSAINYLVFDSKGDNCNLFLGDVICLDVILSIGKKSLNEFTPEEDFILGIMLGYDRRLECERYLKLREKDKIFLAL
ncbi:DUF2023 family protein [bacterium]|nr:DUF2023 family protein [bacterium]